MKLTKELKDLGCILIIDKNPTKGNLFSTTYFRAQIIHSSQTFTITQRTCVISEYKIDWKGVDTWYDVCKFILNTIKGEKKQ